MVGALAVWQLRSAVVKLDWAQRLLVCQGGPRLTVGDVVEGLHAAIEILLRAPDAERLTPPEASGTEVLGGEQDDARA